MEDREKETIKEDRALQMKHSKGRNENKLKKEVHAKFLKESKRE